MSLKLHKEGIRIIPTFFFILAALLAVFHYFIPFEGYWRFLLVLLDVSALVFWGLIIAFFRYPEFDVQQNENQIISPADGTVVVIENTVENEYFNEKRIQVSIFMSPFNTHMNRYPISGDFVYNKYHDGKFLVAWDPKSSTNNERNTIVIKNDKVTILIRQIAGAVARRIRWYGKEGDKVEQGQQLGFIKFGSRVDLFLPLDAKINVKLDQSVRAGKTIIAEI
ncbi:MAG: phosphatidylserine decarboxylase family protein [Bacteroidetes bacterium 4572_112]|nr:MAG: phosphatidylserine decarboxylase family protein [Bacteroidetes bacterium 4572_112]